MDTIARDLDVLCKCASCGGELKDPILLPCIHRICRQCLTGQLTQNDDVIECLQCGHVHRLGTNGAKLVQADYHVELLLECLKVDRLARREDKCGKCDDCGSDRELTSYCFECHRAMCDECFGYHVTATSLRAHKKHTRKLYDLAQMLADGVGDLKTLAGMTVPPACPHHPEKDLEQWCATCQHMVICQTCSYGFHRDHVIEDVGSEFEAKKVRLKEYAHVLEKGMERVSKLADKVSIIQDAVEVKMSTEENRLHRHHEELSSSITQDREDVFEAYSVTRKNLNEKHSKRLGQITLEMESEILGVKKRYEKVFEETKVKNDQDLARLEESQERHLNKLEREERDLEINYETLKETIAIIKNERRETTNRVSEHIDSTTSRYKNFTATVQSIDTIEQWAALSSRKNWWAHLLNIPRICSFVATIGKEVDKQFPELDDLSSVSVPKLTCHCAQKDVPIIAGGTSSTVEVGWKSTRNWEVNDISGDGRGNIVISGHRSHESHVTSCSVEGEQLHQYTRLDGQCLAPFRYCATLTNRRVATACHPCEIGVLDLMTSSYVSANIRDQMKEDWHAERGVSCLAADLANNEIYVGLMGSRDIAVFDDKLRYHRSVSLTYCGNYGPDGLAIVGDTLVVCDYYKGCAFISDLQGNLKHQLDIPMLSKASWKPSRACIDQQGCIYILWKVEFSGERAILQYCSNGHHVLSEVTVDEDGESLTTIQVDGVEKILLATSSTGKIVVYEQIHNV